MKIKIKDLLSKTVINEAFDSFKYHIPEDKSQLMFDFYTIEALPTWFIDKHHPDYEVLTDTVEKTRKQLYTYLKQHLLDKVLFSVAAEFRHISDENGKDTLMAWAKRHNKEKFMEFYLDRTNKTSPADWKTTPDKGHYKKLTQYQPEDFDPIEDPEEHLKVSPKKYGQYERIGEADESANELTNQEEPTKKRRKRMHWGEPYDQEYYNASPSETTPEQRNDEEEDATSTEQPKTPSELKTRYDAFNSSAYVLSYKAIKLSGIPEDEFMMLARNAFAVLRWRSMYGGRPWFAIANGWLKLYNCSDKEVAVYIDHIFDLQHNTDTVFNKIASYSRDSSYGWIKRALEKKKHAKSLYAFWNDISPGIKALAGRVIKAGKGGTLEDFLKQPKTVNPPFTEKDDPITKDLVANEIINEFGEELSDSQIENVMDFARNKQATVSKLKKILKNKTLSQTIQAIFHKYRPQEEKDKEIKDILKTANGKPDSKAIEQIIELSKDKLEMINKLIDDYGTVLDERSWYTILSKLYNMVNDEIIGNVPETLNKIIDIKTPDKISSETLGYLLTVLKVHDPDAFTELVNKLLTYKYTDSEIVPTNIIKAILTNMPYIKANDTIKQLISSTKDKMTIPFIEIILQNSHHQKESIKYIISTLNNKLPNDIFEYIFFRYRNYDDELFASDLNEKQVNYMMNIAYKYTDFTNKIINGVKKYHGNKFNHLFKEYEEMKKKEDLEKQKQAEEKLKQQEAEEKEAERLAKQYKGEYDAEKQQTAQTFKAVPPVTWMNQFKSAVGKKKGL